MRHDGRLPDPEGMNETMCGRVYVKTTLDGMIANFAMAQRSADIAGLANGFPRWNGAPGQDYPIIIQEPDVAAPIFVRARWGFMPGWAREARPGGRPPPVNARAETVATSGMFKNAYRYRRALMPIDGYFEWRDIHGTGKNKQPYAIAMKDGSPFALAAIWESWRDPETGLETRTFAVLTCAPNELMATIHDRMPVILHRKDYQRWLSPAEPDPRDLLKPFPADLMTMWPIDRKVGSPKNNTPDVLDPVDPDPGDLFG